MLCASSPTERLTRHDRSPSTSHSLRSLHTRYDSALSRKLDSNDFELVTFRADDLPPYAVLSHTWIDGEEVTYDELMAGARKDKAGYAKIRFCGERAAHDGLQYFWVDTCCIDKSNCTILGVGTRFRNKVSVSQAARHLHTTGQVTHGTGGVETLAVP